MHSKIYLFSLLALSGAMASCSKDNDEPKIETVETLSGFYTVNSGNQSSKIPSSITAFDYSSGVSTPALEDAFMKANGIALGDGARPAVIYGSKMYIPMTDSNIIWVVDPVTLKVIQTIKPTGDANSPREAVGADGKLFVSMFTGYVCRIDTATLTIDHTIKTGPNTEQMAVAGGKLYVANSDGYNWSNGYADGSISVIDLATLNETKIQDTSKILNPTDIASNGKDVFVICKGNYGDIPATVKKIEGSDVRYVADGTNMAINGDKLYVINAPYGMAREQMSFDIYNTSSLSKEGTMISQTQGTESWVDYPACLAVDPVSGDIVIASQTVSDAGFAQYSEPCYANIYDRTGSFKKRIQCGVGTVGVTFIHKTEIR